MCISCTPTTTTTTKSSRVSTLSWASINPTQWLLMETVIIQSKIQKYEKLTRNSGLQPFWIPLSNLSSLMLSNYQGHINLNLRLDQRTLPVSFFSGRGSDDEGWAMPILSLGTWTLFFSFLWKHFMTTTTTIPDRLILSSPKQLSWEFAIEMNDEGWCQSWGEVRKGQSSGC